MLMSFSLDFISIEETVYVEIYVCGKPETSGQFSLI